MKNQIIKHSEIESDLKALMDWFEAHYSPEDRGIDGKPKGAAFTIKGAKGNVVLTLYYENTNN